MAKVGTKLSETSKTHLKSIDDYHKLYDQSITNPSEFFKNQANQLIYFSTPFQTTTSGAFETANVKWFNGAKLNVCYNCVDRHALKTPEKVAIIYEKDEIGQSVKITYNELLNKG
jgi:acetyl-CoA synthetase